jgi:hypothetical protein
VRKVILICAAITAFAGSVWSSEKAGEDYACFFAGVAMLRSENGLSADSTAVLYRELLALCGVTTEGAVEFLEKNKSDPVKWKSFYESVILAVTERFNTK